MVWEKGSFKPTILSLVAAFVVIMTSCGKDEDTAPLRTACNVPVIAGFASCWDYIGASYTEANVAEACTGGDIGTECGTTGTVGTCAVNGGTLTEINIYYYSEYTATIAESTCLATATNGATAIFTP